MTPLTTTLAQARTENAFATAICGTGPAWTYAALHNAVARTAMRLAECQVPRQTLVYLNVEGEDARLIAALAAMHVGLVPMLIRRPAEVQHCPPAGFTVAAVDAADRVDAARGGDLLIDFKALATEASGGPMPPLAERADDEPYALGATSGTTGMAKPVEVSWGLFKRRHECAVHQHYQSDERVMSTIGPLTYYGFVTNCRVLAAKACIVRAASDATRCLRLINLYGVTTLLTVPQLISAYMDIMERHAIRCPSVRHIALTASLFPSELILRIERLFKADIRVIYGTSETGPLSTGLITSVGFEPGYVGQLLPGVQVLGASGDPEAPGELVFVNSNGTLTQSDSAGEREVRSRDARFTLPDLGSVVSGRVTLAGRADEVYNHGGNKVAFSRIEMALRRGLRVADVAVVAGKAVSGRDAPLVIALVDPTGSVTADAAWALLRQRLPSLALARERLHFVLLPSIARNDAGKVDREAVLAAVG